MSSLGHGPGGRGTFAAAAQGLRCGWHPIPARTQVGQQTSTLQEGCAHRLPPGILLLYQTADLQAPLPTPCSIPFDQADFRRETFASCNAGAIYPETKP